MAEPLKEIPANLLYSTNVALSDAGATSDHAAWIRKPGNAALLVAFMDGKMEEVRSAPTRGDDLPPNHYRIHVNRGPLPSMATFKEQFEGGVSEFFDGGHKWEKHPSRMGANDVTAEEVVVYVHDFGREIDSGEAIAWGLENGYVPSDEKEAYAVGIDPQTRDLQKRNWLVALGSSAMSDGDRYVAMLNSDSDRRFLNVRWFGHVWHSDYRFLFVRK